MDGLRPARSALCPREYVQTTFDFSTAFRHKMASRRRDEVERKRLRVLIVEDSEDDAELVKVELRRLGYDALAERVASAEAMHAALSKTWDVILADYMIPGFGGSEALRIVEEHGADVPFIIVSGSIGEETAVAMMKAGAADYIAKANLARLGPAIARELRDADTRHKHHEAEEALRASHALLKAVTEGTTDAVFVKDREGRYLMINSAGARALGHSVEVVLGKTDMQLVRSDVAEGIVAADQGVMKSGKAQTYEESIQVSGEWRTFMTTKGPYVDHRGDVVGVFGIARDITARKRAEDAQRSLAADNARLYEQANEAILARDEFLSVASHELRTPMSTLMLQLQSLQRVLAEPHSDGRATKIALKLAIALRQTDRLAKLIDGLLDVSRIATGRFTLDREIFDLAEVVRDVTERFREEAMRNGCQLVLNDVHAEGSWDRMRIEQAITNLLSNAIKYAPGKPIEVSMDVQPERVMVAVRDQGMGIAKDDINRIFEKFERAVAARSYGGLGLGLFITREIVDAHGGFIRVTSEPGRGSTFILDLPRETSFSEGGAVAA